MYYNQLVLRYEVDDFEGKVLEMYKELEPLYKQLHAYVRRRLHSKYGSVSKLLVINVVITSVVFISRNLSEPNLTLYRT